MENKLHSWNLQSRKKSSNEVLSRSIFTSLIRVMSHFDQKMQNSVQALVNAIASALTCIKQLTQDASHWYDLVLGLFH